MVAYQNNQQFSLMIMMMFSLSYKILRDIYQVNLRSYND